MIEIPEEQYRTLNATSQNDVVAVVDDALLIKAIKNGTPLPEHYDLIERDTLKQRIASVFPMVCGGVASEIDNAPTIIPATKEKSCKNCKYGKAYEHGADITTMDDECGGCCSWNDKWTPKQTATKEGDAEC